MERQCEPELMDEPEQVAAYGAADFAAGDQALTEAINLLLGPPAPAAAGGERILDLGCGPGNISFRLMAARPSARVLGLDGSARMLALARQRQQADPRAQSGLQFHQALLPLPAGWSEAVPPPFRPPFHALVSNSLLHHLHDPQVLWRSLVPLAAPGALVVVRDLRRPPTPEALQWLVERHAAGAPAVLRRDLAASLQAAFRVPEVQQQLEQSGLEGLAVQELGDCYLQVSGRLPAGRLDR